MTLTEIREAQQAYFAAGNTIPLKNRRQYLTALLQEIKNREKEICRALHEDLRKSEFEARTTETSIVLDEIAAFLKNLNSYAKPRSVRVSMLNFPAKGLLYPEPYGKVLIFSAWNYPFQLMMSPFAGAIAAGNCAILKPAEQAPATADVIEKIISEVFPAGHAAVCRGGHEMTRELLSEEFDYLFYTGGPAGAKIIMKAAAEHLTPLTLELGGKSPCFVDSDAKLDLAAKRIVWGKYLNAGQTCVAPDYVLAHKAVRNELVERLKYWIHRFYGEDPFTSEDYPRIINRRHCERLAALMNGSEILCGGTVNLEENYIAPTLLAPLEKDAPVMQEEIFGPLLPILEVASPDEAIEFIRKRPKPLALYYFSDTRKNLNRILSETSSGGVAVNETITHLINPEMPFGGVGASGFGAYHGKKTFDTFTHEKPVMIKSNRIDLPMRYPPNLNKNLKILDLISK